LSGGRTHPFGQVSPVHARGPAAGTADYRPTR
jgi:hypothetical protein